MRGSVFACLAMLAGCGQIIGIRELGVDAQSSATNVDGGSAVDGGDSPPGEADPDATPDTDGCPIPNLAGQWTGTFTADFFQKSWTLAADLHQSCTVLGGSVDLDACNLDAGAMLATIDDQGGLSGTISSGNTVIMTLKGTVTSPNQMQGTFANPQYFGNCFATGGTFLFDHL